jgi:hypothetical protein
LKAIVLTPSAVNQIPITGHPPNKKWKLRELLKLYIPIVGPSISAQECPDKAEQSFRTNWAKRSFTAVNAQRVKLKELSQA